MLSLVEELSARADVTLLTFGDGPRLGFQGVRVVTVPHRPLSTLRANVGAALPTLPLQVRLYLDARMRTAVARELATGAPDVVHVTLARLAPYLPPPDAVPHRHLDLVDALSRNMASRAGASPQPLRSIYAGEARLMRRYEGRAVGWADTSSVVAVADRDALPQPTATAVIPNGVDRRQFPYREPRDGDPPVLVFFGNLGYFHNVEPARFAASEVLPRVRAVIPQTRLRLVGARPTATLMKLADLEGVELVGPVEAISAELHKAAVAVLPSFSGSGIKNTILEAFSSGTPVVANGQAMRAVEGAASDRHFLPGETAADMAVRCVALLRSAPLRRTLAQHGQQLVEERYTWGRQAEALLALYGRDGG